MRKILVYVIAIVSISAAIALATDEKVKAGGSVLKAASIETAETRYSAILPDGFVCLHDIDPSIQVDLRYMGKDNFLCRKVNGYNNSKAVILTKQAAQALKKSSRDF